MLVNWIALQAVLRFDATPTAVPRHCALRAEGSLQRFFSSIYEFVLPKPFPIGNMPHIYAEDEEDLADIVCDPAQHNSDFRARGTNLVLIRALGFS